MKPAVRKFWLLFLSINIVLVLCLFLGLKLYTSHGQSIEIPVLVGLSLDEAQKILDEMGLEVVVADSLFDSKIPAGSVIESDPTAGIQVKLGRRVYLTLNAFTPPLAMIPNLTDISYHKATIDLKSKGFVIGRIIKKQDIAKDFVIAGEFNGRTLKEGEKLPMGTIIDLIVGTSEGALEEDSTEWDVYEDRPQPRD